MITPQLNTGQISSRLLWFTGGAWCVGMTVALLSLRHYQATPPVTTAVAPESRVVKTVRVPEARGPPVPRESQVLFDQRWATIMEPRSAPATSSAASPPPAPSALSADVAAPPPAPPKAIPKAAPEATPKATPIRNAHAEERLTHREGICEHGKRYYYRGRHQYWRCRR
jgi:hypothetical protein